MWHGFSAIDGSLLNRIYAAQEPIAIGCNAKNDDSSKVVGNIKENRIICNYQKIILIKLQ
jgi:hypothetical protein